MRTMIHWLNARFPLISTWRAHFSAYDAPKNFNFFYFFGSLALLVLVIQLVSGLWLTMFYTPTIKEAFHSVEYIMRDVSYGWFIRYLHSTGASAFFIVIYLHLFRALLYGSYQKPRELVWLIGMVLFILLLAEAFFGYLLPWGQLSYWGAQVITSLFSAIPWVGDTVVAFIRGDYYVGDPTLHRFFAFHVVAVPLLLIFLVYLHIVALHHVGSNNPEGIDITLQLDATGRPLDAVSFHPYYTVKDLFGAVVFLFFFFAVLFFIPDFGGYFLEHANFAPADPLVTPAHISPVWYMTPFYAMLRAIPNKLFGVVTMGSAILIFFFLPWLDRSSVRSMRYKGPFSKIALCLGVISFCLLGYLGTVDVTPIKVLLARLGTFLYFAYFILMPIYSRLEPTRVVPDRILT
jgi:ubiquinol-cytochrome c reductase cytochrome b subunit